MAKTLIVSNRLPVRIQKEGESLQYKPSVGGLATGLGSIYKQENNLWIGWPGLYTETDSEKKLISRELEKENLRPVFLSQEDIKEFYEGFSNATLWPTFHYFAQYAVYEERFWEAYQRVNQKFAEAIVEIAEPDDTIWIHDYQLLLLPKLIREKLPDSSIGFFLHIPFPSFEIFRYLPWRRDLLLGMLGADLIGFHTYDDMRHFLSSVNRLAGLGYVHGQVEIDNRTITVDAFPMGIDYQRYAESAISPETINREVRFRQSLGGQQIMLSIDRLDYSKGIPQRLRAFDLFFEKFPEYKEKVSLVLIVVPSRDKVEQYQQLKIEIDELVGRINGKYSRMAWTPIHYFYRSFPMSALSALYRIAHVALITPLRDGMNLVCKEFVASKVDKRGVLILSEMAGAAKELSDAILINPNDINQLVDAMRDALSMSEEEQMKHMSIMQNSLMRYNIHHWVKLFMDRLSENKARQRDRLARLLDQKIINQLLEQYRQAQFRMIFLDYDGTLIPFANNPHEARPDQELLDLLRKLGDNNRTRVVIMSGSGRDTLGTWLAEMPVDLICEHGIWHRQQGKDWETIKTLSDDWKRDIFPVMDLYVNRTPGSFIEEKNYSLVWHYRKVEAGLGELRTRELSSHLRYLTNNMPLQVLEGEMVIEVKDAAINKGKAAAQWIEKFESDLIIVVGVDNTDEDTFKAVPEDAFTVKVGHYISEAKYYLNSPNEVRSFLRQLIEENKM
ncbi:MAG: bifunctional alpha,alpha-trehalose-phosphate synthase (UDP-forming)/trehalose-phosphatase [Bacteroidia bacterium]|nr:bifunctional alpha,alpha-trehalose-phosphate synthase (UDP-forming)/trehalose-phosphatase [Bacteroidia bacterium]